MRKLFLLFLCLFIAGCATANKGSYQEIEINSNVAGALVELNGVEIGRTPFKGKIKRDGIDKVKVKTDYAFNEIQLDKRGGIILGADTQGLAISSKGTEGGAAITVVGAGVALIVGISVVGISGLKPREPDPCPSLDCLSIGSSMLGVAFYLVSEMNKTSERSKYSAAWEYSPSQYYVELKEEGSSDWDFINDIAIRSFAMANHSQIAIDAGNDGGEYVEALADLMETKKDRETAKRDINEALEESKGDQVAFGDALVARFRE